MFAAFKNFSLYGFYIAGALFIILALLGKLKLPFYLLTILLPLRNVVEKLHEFPFGKDFLDILLIAMLVGWIFRAIGEKDIFFEHSPLNGIIIALILYTLFSVFYGSSYLRYEATFGIPDIRFQNWKNYCTLPFIYFLTFNNAKDKESIFKLLFVMCLTMVVMSFYLLQQMAWYSSIESRLKITGTFVFLGANEIAAFYNMYTSILVGIFFYVKNKKIRIFLLGLIYVNIVCILFLFSRGAYIALFVGLLFLLLFKKRVLLIPLILAALCWQVALPEKVQDRIKMTTDEYGHLDKSNQGRLLIWEQSLELFGKSPIVGVGFGVFQYLGFDLKDTHNIYLKILAEQGIIGLVIFLILIMILFIQGMQLHANSDDDFSKGLGLGFAACIIVLIINNMFGDRWTYLELSAYLWMFAAFVTRLNVILKNEQAAAVKPKPRVKHVK